MSNKKKPHSIKNESNNSHGNFPIHRVKQGRKHPHVVVYKGDKENISVGLTSKNPRGDLFDVNYTNGKKAFMKRTATRQSNKKYDDKELNLNLDKKSEDLAYRIATNKLLKDIGKNKKRNH